MPRSSEPSPAVPAPSDASTGAVDLHVRVELLDIAARAGAVTASITICVVILLYALLPAGARAVALAGWLAAMVAVSAARIVLARVWIRKRAAARPRVVGRDEAAHWETYHVAIALAAGLAWAGLVVVGVPTIEQTTLLVAFALTIALVLASTSYAGDPGTHAAFALPIVVAQAINLQRLPIDRPALVVVAWLALVVVLYVVPRLTGASVRDTVLARLDHERRAYEQSVLFDTAPLGILVVRDLRIANCNDALLHLMGYERKEELIGQDIRVLLPDEEAWEMLQHDSRLAVHGPVAPSVVRRRRRDGSVVDVMRNVSAMRSASGERAFIGIYEDIGERLASEENYRHALRMQRLVFESAGEGIAIVNDGRIEQANQALSDLIGVPVMQLTTRTLQSIFEDPGGWSEIEKRFQRLGNTLKLERRMVRSDGRAIWVNVTGCLVDAPSTGGESKAGGKRSIWILADLSVQKQKEAENWHHANHDVMTGLPNRRFLQDRLDQALAFARRDGRRVAVLELDLDGFKSVNDGYGHRFGDAVLEEVARRLSMVVRELDTVGRWGGDEFVLVLKEIDSREVVEETVMRVIARLSEPIAYLGHSLSIGASIGIALFPDHGEDVETLMLAADLAMYESKASGGNTWRFSSSPGPAPRGKYRPAAAPLSS